MNHQPRDFSDYVCSREWDWKDFLRMHICPSCTKVSIRTWNDEDRTCLHCGVKPVEKP